MKNMYSGLTTEQVNLSRQSHGSNQLTPRQRDGFWSMLLEAFKDPTIIILLVALIIVTGLAIFGYTHWYEGVAIFGAVTMATGIATYSQYKNESGFQALLDEASKIDVKVFRNGVTLSVPIDEIVAGDFVLLKSGDKVPADGVIVEGHVALDQSSLTGEPDPVKKTALDKSATAVADLHSPHHVFRGSIAVDGEAIVEILNVGDNSLYGKLIDDMQSADRDSPLTVKLKVLADGIGKLGTLGAIAIALAFMAQKLFMERALTMDTVLPYLVDSANWAAVFADFMTALVLAVVIVVVAVPEGLPMMIAVVLALNMRKLLREKVLVRKLLGIEASGSLNILFSDKTGTLTKGVLQVSTVLTGDGNQHSVLSNIPTGQRDALSYSLRNNTSAVVEKDAGVWRFIGADRTELALLQFGADAFDSTPQDEIVNNVIFNSSRKYSAVQTQGGFDGSLIKGAPELLLSQCLDFIDGQGARQSMTAEHRAVLEREMNALADRSMRLLLLATSPAGIRDEDKISGPLTLVGIVGLRDELRDESKSSVQRAQQAGIQVVMVTGDRKETAQAIAREVGIIDIPDAVVLTATELDAIDDNELKRIMPKLRIVSRAYPHQKSRLVKVAQEMGLVCGMTGDGVNDGAALKRADVGFAMGSGTEVAKEAGDIIVLDDNFASITQAVLYGRTLFKSIRKFLVFQLTVNVSAILVAFIGPLMGFDLPLTMVQLLWINLIMDTLAAIAFSGDAALKRYMQEKPVARDASLIGSDMWSSILVNGTFIAGLSMFFLTSDTVRSWFSSDAAFLTGFFAFFVFVHNFNKFNARTTSLNLAEHITENKGFLYVVLSIFIIQIVFTYLGGDVLRTVGLSASEWGMITLMAAVIIPVDLLRKAIRNIMGKSPETLI